VLVVRKLTSERQSVRTKYVLVRPSVSVPLGRSPVDAIALGILGDRGSTRNASCSSIERMLGDARERFLLRM